MTNVSFYPRESWTPGREAVQVTTSASPYEAIARTSALGMALYGATEALDILAYPASNGVVFEGNIAIIDANLPRLHEDAESIALDALRTCSYGADKAGGLSYLTSLVSRVGAPLEEGRDGFRPRMIQSVSAFAQETTWDGCLVHRYGRPYQPPIDHRVETAVNDVRWHASEYETTKKVIDLPVELEQFFKQIAELDGLANAKLAMTAALKYYRELRITDPDLDMKIDVYKSARKYRSARSRTNGRS
ncbi:MAG: hypothetical protein WBB94_00880 [Candidatus Saccharimonadaceae bacterium]